MDFVPRSDIAVVRKSSGHLCGRSNNLQPQSSIAGVELSGRSERDNVAILLSNNSYYHCYYDVCFNSALSFRKLMFLEFLLSVSQTFVRPMSALQEKIFLLLDALQLLMLFVSSLTYLESKRFLFIIFCNCTFLINQILLKFKINIRMYIYFVFSQHTRIGVTTLIKQLLLSK
jgi:hypothetical protein